MFCSKFVTVDKHAEHACSLIRFTLVYFIVIVVGGGSKFLLKVWILFGIVIISWNDFGFSLSNSDINLNEEHQLNSNLDVLMR